MPRVHLREPEMCCLYDSVCFFNDFNIMSTDLYVSGYKIIAGSWKFGEEIIIKIN